MEMQKMWFSHADNEISIIFSYVLKVADKLIKRIY